MKKLLVFLLVSLASCATVKIYDNDENIKNYPNFFRSQFYIIAELEALAPGKEDGRFWVVKKAEIGKHLGIIQFGEAGEMPFLAKMGKTDLSKKKLQELSNCYSEKGSVRLDNWNKEEINRIHILCSDPKSHFYTLRADFLLDPKDYIFMEDEFSDLSTDVLIFNSGISDSVAYLLTKDPEKMKAKYLQGLQEKESDIFLKNISKESVFYINSDYGYKGWESLFTAYFNPIENSDITNIYQSVSLDEFRFQNIENELKNIRGKKYVLLKNLKSFLKVGAPDHSITSGWNWEVSSYNFKTKKLSFNYETGENGRLTIKPFSIKMEPSEAQDFIASKEKRMEGEFRVLAKIKSSTVHSNKKLILEPVKWSIKWKGKEYGNDK